MKALRDRNLMFDPDVDVYDYLKKHQQRMRDVQCKIDCTAPRENEVLVSNYTDKRTVQDSKRRIDRQNTVLVNSLFRIMEGSRPTPSTSAATNDYKIATEKKLSKQHPGTLNYSKRVRDAQKIHEKNIIIASRLESIKPVYSIEDLTNKTINIKRNSRLYTTTGINPYNASTGMNLEDANSTPFSSSGLTAFKLEHKDDLDELLNVVATNGNQSRPSSSAALRPANYRKTTRIYSTVPYASPLRPHSAPTFASSTPHATTPKKLDLIKQYHSLPCQPNNRQNSNLSSGLEMPSTDLRPYYANDLDAPNSVTSVRSSVVEGSISNATINRLSAPSPHKRYDTNDNTNPGYYNLSDKESHTVNACKFGTGDRFYNDKEEPIMREQIDRSKSKYVQKLNQKVSDSKNVVSIDKSKSKSKPKQSKVKSKPQQTAPVLTPYAVDHSTAGDTKMSRPDTAENTHTSTNTPPSTATSKNNNSIPITRRSSA